MTESERRHDLGLMAGVAFRSFYCGERLLKARLVDAAEAQIKLAKRALRDAEIALEARRAELACSDRFFAARCAEAAGIQLPVGKVDYYVHDGDRGATLVIRPKAPS